MAYDSPGASFLSVGSEMIIDTYSVEYSQD